MNAHHGASNSEREEPPFVAGLIGGAIKQSSSMLRTIVRSVNQQVLMMVWGGGAIAVAVLMVIASVADSPTVVGFVRGIFAGLFMALLFAAGFGWMLLWARGSSRESPKAAGTTPAPRVAALNSQLAPVISELDALRADIIRQVKARSVIRVPLGIAGGIALWVLVQRGDDPPGFLGLILYVVLGALAGEVWAAYKLERQYRRRYKDSVLPQLASGIGNLTYRRASRERVTSLGAQRILPEHDTADADDEITGTYDGLAVDIVEARLRRRQGKKSRVVFEGLLVGITLPRSLTGTTAILTDMGVWENFKARWRGGTLEPVKLEHAEFERRYEVYGTDQIEARALLTPAFMERFMALSANSGFAPPGALAEGNKLVVALPKRMGMGDLFEPPAYWKPAGGDALVRLQDDIKAVLGMADTVIHLDFWASGRQRDALRQRSEPHRA